MMGNAPTQAHDVGLCKLRAAAKSARPARQTESEQLTIGTKRRDADAESQREGSPSFVRSAPIRGSPRSLASSGRVR
jgi:hypothetical protein